MLVGVDHTSPDKKPFRSGRDQESPDELHLCRVAASFNQSFQSVSSDPDGPPPDVLARAPLMAGVIPKSEHSLCDPSGQVMMPISGHSMFGRTRAYLARHRSVKELLLLRDFVLRQANAPFD